MTNEQHAELNQWIAENVMDAKIFVGLKKRGYWYRPNAHGYTGQQSEAWHITRDEAKKHEYLRGDEPVTICEFDTPKYTTSPADAIAVLEKIVREKCGVKIENVYCDGDNWRIYESDIDDAVYAETLPLALCLFTKSIFGKDSK